MDDSLSPKLDELTVFQRALASKFRSFDRATKSSIFSPRSSTLTRVFFWTRKHTLNPSRSSMSRSQECLLCRQDPSVDASTHRLLEDSKRITRRTSLVKRMSMVRTWYFFKVSASVFISPFLKNERTRFERCEDENDRTFPQFGSKTREDKYSWSRPSPGNRIGSDDRSCPWRSATHFVEKSMCNSLRILVVWNNHRGQAIWTNIHVDHAWKRDGCAIGCVRLLLRYRWRFDLVQLIVSCRSPYVHKLFGQRKRAVTEHWRKRERDARWMIVPRWNVIYPRRSK